MLNQLTISELQKRIVARDISAREAVHACLDQIKRVDGSVKAFLSYDEADALQQADEMDKLIAEGATLERYPLLGVPIAIKDVLAVKGHPLNCASRILGKFVSPYDATVIEKLRNAGAIIFGR